MIQQRQRKKPVSVTRGIALGALLGMPSVLASQAMLASTAPHSVSTASRASTLVAASDAESPMDRIVRLSIRNAPIPAILDLIAQQAEVRMVYRDAAFPENRRITMRDVRLTVRDALTHVLNGTGVVAQLTTSGSIALIDQSGIDSVPVPIKGQIVGQVIDSASKDGVPNAVVTLRGTRYATQTKENGSFVLTGVPAGSYTAEVRLLGYTARAISVTVGTASQTVNFALQPAATHLSSVVTTAAGEQERVKVGNSIATIDAEEVVRDMPIRNLTDLIESRVPGLTTTHSGGSVGAGSRLRIRGLRSANSSNEPIVILDGIRIMTEALDNDRNANLPGKNSRPSRLDDIDPTTIESIDILKGPSAASLYGSDAANGVIVIKTKRPVAGAPKWQLSADRSNTQYKANYPKVWRSMGSYLSGYSTTCTLETIATGYCAQVDSVLTFDIMGDKSTTPFTNGYDGQISANVSGGSSTLRYFLSGSHLDQLGASKVPDVNVAIYERIQGAGAASKSMIRPNAQTNTNFTGSVNVQLGSRADALVRSTLLSRFQRRGSDGYQGAFNAAAARSEGDTTTPVPTWSGIPNKRSDKVLRSTTGLAANWRPFTWAATQFGYGYDYAVNNDIDLMPRNVCKPFCSQYAYAGAHDSLGYVYFGRRQTEVKSGNLGFVGTWSFPKELGFQIATGAQYVKSSYDDLNGFAGNLAAGRSSPTSASGTKNVDQAYDETATAGWYFQPKISWRDRLYVSAGLRRDVASALGADVKPVYPKWDLSYLVSEESFFAPLSDYVNTMRVRAAFGHAGLQPATSAKVRSFSQLVRLVTPTGLENYAMLVGVGNEQLRPERSVEMEWGTDIELFDSRVRLDLTWFREKTRDAIMLRPLGPSVGTTTTRRENVGMIKNTGMEADIGLTVVRNRKISYDLNIGYGSHRNLVESLGPNVLPFSLYATLQGTDDGRVVPGYPLFGRWAKPIVGYYDQNGDGIVAKSEIRYGDSMVYMGPSEPKYQLSMNHSVGFLNDRIRVSALLAYTDKFVQFNEYRANAAFSSDIWNVIAATPAQLQSQVYAAASNGVTRYGYLESTNTLRFNSLSVQGVLPDKWARSIRASQASVTLMGSNIGMWSSYTGADPSVNTTATSGNRVQDNGALPIPRTWGLRVALTY